MSGDVRIEECATVGSLRRALEEFPDDLIVNVVDGDDVIGERVHVRHVRGSEYVDVGVICSEVMR